ncbi:MAG: hypothetical protein ACK5OB_10410 [Pirellula sp.]
MTNDRVVQPLVACLGNPVAGNPTQFVMSRIARHAELDWRFFTSEVEESAFDAAFAGIKALGMAGAAIFAPFPERAAALVDRRTPVADRMGRVGVIKWESGQWIGDETKARAVVRSMVAHIANENAKSVPSTEPPPEAFAVFGSRAFAASIAWELAQVPGDYEVAWCGQHPSSLALGSAQPSVAVGSDSDAVAEESAGAKDSKGQGANGTAVDSTSRPEGVLVKPIALEALAEVTRPVRGLILETTDALMGLDKSQRNRWLRDLPWSERPLAAFGWEGWSLSQDSSRNAAHGECEQRSVVVIDELEWMAYQAAADFQFWTGYDADLDLIRESLEEYLQW